MRNIDRTLLTGISGLAIWATPSIAFAKDTDSDKAADDNVIIVTAAKRQATLQETPIAVSVTTAERIEDAQVRDLLDLQTLTPSLRVNQTSLSSVTVFSIRGFGNGGANPGIEPSVGVFVDGVYRSRAASQISDLPDLQRVEVLNGPQSTLFGKNASAGIISIVTREPQFEYGGVAELSYGNFDAVVAKASVTGPISDTVAFSLGGNYNRRDGYIEDIIIDQDINNRDRFGLRGQLLFKPSADFKLRLIADYDKIDEVCCGATNVVDGPTGAVVRAVGGQFIPNDGLSLQSTVNFAPTNEIENYGVSLQTDWSTGAIDVTGIGSYRRSDTFVNQDSDFTSLNSIGTNINTVDVQTYTGELRAASDFDGPIDFLVGGFLFHEKIDQGAEFGNGEGFLLFANAVTGGAYSALEPTLRALVPGIPAGSFGGVGQGRTLDYDYENTSFSIFGQVDFEVTDRLTLTVGANYTEDEKQVVSNNISTDVFSGIDLVQAGFNAALVQGAPAAVASVLASDPTTNPFLALRGLQFNPPYLNFPNAVEDGRTDDKDLSYTLRLSYDATDNLSLYATYATGFKASSFNLSANSLPFASDFVPGSPFQSPPPAASPIRDAGLAVPNLATGSRFAGPEESEVYEIGIKGRWDGFSFNLAVFDQTLNGFQANVFTGVGFILGNADEQSVRGFELDTQISPIPELTFTAGVTYLDSLFDSFPDGNALSPNFTVVPADLSGQRPAGVPEWSVIVGGTYTLDLSDDASLRFHTDYQLESNVELVNGLSTFKRAVENLNASITLGLSNGLEVSLWGRNLTDAAYLNAVSPAVGQPGSLVGFRNQPRTYGGLVRYRF
ncbi:TonB-dependent receptor [Altererythrobacter lutimaris]|uniref:TonB-dependent receptor n=1 Tax=Altererythrobacter lutimaris TaxID=2743979 RepID=A0A850H8Y9_9SPHN|nr:TonB-dependent receptor [Altererythrobacter lutimaris]NVE94343.1 TonB-dependent receptor [Altererythrobacter lutimaris]